MSVSECCRPETSPNVSERNHANAQGEFLNFSTETAITTVYNNSIPILDSSGRTIILGRTEELADEASSRVTPYDLYDRTPINGLVLPRHQDPYFCGTFDDGRNVFGAVKITVEPESGKISDWQDHLYAFRGSLMDVQTPADLELVATGEHHQKDNRITQLIGRVGAITRPQGAFGGAGSFGYFETPDLSTLQTDMDAFYEQADNATLIEGILEEGEWGGPNQLIPIDERYLYVVGHKAWRARQTESGEPIRHYKGIGFMFDTQTRQLASNVQTLVEATSFAPVNPKFSDLGHVWFMAGLHHNTHRNALYAYGGIGDVKVGRIAINASIMPLAVRKVLAQNKAIR